MSNVYFVRTHTHYDPYQDFFKLAELSGYPVIMLSEIDAQSDNTYIFTPLNGETENGWKDAKAQIILWDCEWRIGESSYEWAENLLVTPPGVSRVWASDKWYASKINAEYVPLGSHVGLVGDTELTSDAPDIAMLAYLSGRRQHIAAQLQDEHRLKLAPNCWNPERDAMLKSVSAMVHVHQHDNVPTIAPLRFAIAAAYKLPLISEQVYERDLYDGCVLFADYEELPHYTSVMVRRYGDMLKEHGEMLHDRLCVSNSFRSFVDAAL